MSELFDGYRYIPGGPGPYGGSSPFVVAPNGEYIDALGWCELSRGITVRKVRGKEIFIINKKFFSRQDAIKEVAKALLSLPQEKRKVYVHAHDKDFVNGHKQDEFNWALAEWNNERFANAYDRKEAEFNEKGYIVAGSIARIPPWAMSDEYLNSLLILN